MFILRFFFYFTLSFFLLCVPIRNQKLFYYLEDFTYPVFGEIFDTIRFRVEEGLSLGIKEGLQKARKTGTALFSQEKKSSALRSERSRIESSNDTEAFTDAERAALMRVMQEGQ